ncbi:MAG TPA: tetratricopeptide repeat protein [Anaerolineae bacterium]|nr:tetratricopeptide repeat protein [Anaerolineae bacterium]
MTKRKKTQRDSTGAAQVVRSGGVDLDANQVTVGGDVAGRDIVKTIQEAPAVGVVGLHQLPPPPRDFTGREDELKELLDAIEHGGVTICGAQGMGGVGKTALALKLAEVLAPKYPDAQFFLDLKGAHEQKPLTPAEAMAHVIRAYHPTAKLPDGEAELRGLYHTVLHGQRALLLLDNARDAAQIEPLIPPSTCVLIVTSRQHFHVSGLRRTNLDALPHADACALLLKIADRLGAHADEIAKLCGYLPLALTLAGKALAERIDLSPSEYARRLTDAKKRLELIDASLSLSYGLLGAELQKLWRMLAVFPDTFDRHAAAAVWDVEDDPAQDALSELLKYSLVDYLASPKGAEEGTEGTGGRYRLHDLTRLFADSRLGDAERAEAQKRHAEHFKNVLSAADDLYLKGSENVLRGLALFDLEWTNIQAGQAWSANYARDSNHAAQLCEEYPLGGHNCLVLRQHPRDQIQWAESALVAARRLTDQFYEGIHLGILGLAYSDLGETRRAIEHYEQALSIARVRRDRRNEGVWLGNLGNAHADLAETRRAIAFYEQTLTIDREIGDRRGEGNTLGNLGRAYAALGETHHAIEFYEQQLVITREIGDLRHEGNALGNLGRAHAALGETRRAIEFYEQALAIAREIGDRRGEGADLGNLGRAHAALGETRRAIEFYEQALAIAREIGDRRGEGAVLGNLGLAFADLGETRRSIEFHQQALAIAREIVDRRVEGAALWNMSLALDKLGEREKAIAHAEAALGIYEQIEDPNAAKVRKQLAEWRGVNE